MKTFAAIFLLEVAGVALTAFGCRFALRHYRQAGWHLALVAAVVASALFVLLTDGSLLLRPPLRDQGKTSLAIVFQGFLLWISITIIPTLIVVYQYRKKARCDGKKMVERPDEPNERQ